MEIINQSNFDEVISNGVVLVDFYADWCGPCKMLTPILEEVDAELENAKVVKVNVDIDSALAQRYGVQAIPNMIIFKDGKAVDQLTGFKPKTEIVSHLQAQL